MNEKFTLRFDRDKAIFCNASNQTFYILDEFNWEPPETPEEAVLENMLINRLLKSGCLWSTAILRRLDARQKLLMETFMQKIKDRSGTLND